MRISGPFTSTGVGTAPGEAEDLAQTGPVETRASWSAEATRLRELHNALVDLEALYGAAVSRILAARVRFEVDLTAEHVQTAAVLLRARD